MIELPNRLRHPTAATDAMVLRVLRRFSDVATAPELRDALPMTLSRVVVHASLRRLAAAGEVTVVRRAVYRARGGGM